MIILFRSKNKTARILPLARTKRETISLNSKTQVHTKDERIKFKDSQVQKARKIISEHDVLCNEATHKDVCRDLIMKLKSLTDNNFSDNSENKGNEKNENENKSAITNKLEDTTDTDLSKKNPVPLQRATKSVPFEKDASGYGPSNQMYDTIPHLNSHGLNNLPLSDSCLMSRLIKPNFHGKLLTQFTLCVKYFRL